MNNDTLLMLIVLPVVGLVVLTLAVGGYLVVRDTVRRRGKWGVNARPVFCPNCGEPAPIIRKPRNRRQRLWGGATCRGVRARVRQVGPAGGRGGVDRRKGPGRVPDSRTQFDPGRAPSPRR